MSSARTLGMTSALLLAVNAHTAKAETKIFLKMRIFCLLSIECDISTWICNYISLACYFQNSFRPSALNLANSASPLTRNMSR